MSDDNQKDLGMNSREGSKDKSKAGDAPKKKKLAVFRLFWSLGKQFCPKSHYL